MLCGPFGHSPPAVRACGLLHCGIRNRGHNLSVHMCEYFSRLATEQRNHCGIQVEYYLSSKQGHFKNDISNYTSTAGIGWNCPGQSRMYGLPRQEGFFFS